MKIVPVPGQLVTGLAIGVAAVVLAPVVLPIAPGILKTIAKATIKGGLLAYARGKVALAEALETVEDITAEAKAELSEENGAGSAPKKKRVRASGARKKAAQKVAV